MAITVVDQGDGTTLISGVTVITAGGLVTIGSPAAVLDNGDGTVTVRDGGPADGLTVTPQSGNLPPRIQIELAGVSGSTVTIVRIDQAGNETPVRTANPAALSGGGAIVWDYEAPYNRAVTYRATTSSGTAITSSAATLTVGQPWLIHPGIPDLSQPLTVELVGDRTYETNQGVHKILGRRDPIVITDGQRSAPTFDLTVRTAGIDEEDAMFTLLDDASTLLLQVVYGNLARGMYQWVSIGSVTESDKVPWFGSDYQVWTLPCTGTGSPAGMLQSQRTLGTLAADFTTLGDIDAAYATLRDVVTDTRVGS